MKKTLSALALLSLSALCFADDTQLVNVKGVKSDKQMENVQPTQTSQQKGKVYDEKQPGHQDMVAAINLLKTGGQSKETQEEAFSLLKKAADQGNYFAQREIANWYLHGFGTPQNKEKAITYFNKAADQGDPQAMIALGTYYISGTGGIEINFEKANQYFERATKIDTNRKLYTYIGNSFLKSKSEIGASFAIPWLEKGASAGDNTAEYLLSVCKLQGVGTPKNIPEGLAMLQQSADSGNPMAMADMGLIFEKGMFDQKENNKNAYLLYTLALTGTPVAADGQSRTAQKLSKSEIKQINKKIAKITEGESLSDFVKFN